MAGVLLPKGEKTQLTLEAIKQIAKQTQVSVREVTYKQCNNLLSHLHKTKASEPLFYQCRNKLEKAITCKTCGAGFDQQWKLMNHIRAEHPKLVPSVARNSEVTVNGRHAPRPAQPTQSLPKVSPMSSPATRPGMPPAMEVQSIEASELPQLIDLARNLISRLGKESAKKFIDVV